MAYINVGCYYIVGVPLGSLLGFYFNLGAKVNKTITIACNDHNHLGTRSYLSPGMTTMMAGDMGRDDGRNGDADADPVVDHV